MSVRVTGVMGGTFDPIHRGHVEIAGWLRDELRLPHMLLMPTAAPPHKNAEELASSSHRVAMVRLAIAEDPRLELCELELQAGRICFTIDSLRTLRDRAACKPVFVLGVDALLDLPTWKDYTSLIGEFDLLVVDRPERQLDSVRCELHPRVAERIAIHPTERVARELARSDLRGRILPVRGLSVAVSSSDIRRRVAAGLPIDELVPPGVARYIQDNGLYRQEDER